MDGGSDSSIWSRITRLFHDHDSDSVEKAILEAREDGELEAEEGSMLLSILRLDDLQMQDIMTPRTDMDCAESGTPLAEVAKLIISSGHSRIPIYQDTRDNIIGIAFAKDLLPSLIDPAQHLASIDTLMREPFFVPETKVVSELLQEFRTRKTHLAIAVDEYGGTSGLATIENILEEIVGDIEDEHDTPREEEVKIIEEGVYLLSGRVYLEDLEELGIILTSDEVDTIGGYLSQMAGHVPQVDESFVIGDLTFTIAEADAKQIRSIRMEPTARVHNLAELSKS